MNTSNHVRRAACHWLNQARLATDAGHALVSATSTSSVVVIDGAKHAQSHEAGPQHGAKLSEGVGCRRYASASASVSGAEAMMKQKSSKFPVQTEEELHVKGEQLMGQSLRVTKAVDDPTHTDKWMQDKTIPAPVDMIAAVEPIPINGDSVYCTHGEVENCGLGAPKTYYRLLGSTKENPVVCKYCGLRYYTTKGAHYR